MIVLFLRFICTIGTRRRWRYFKGCTPSRLLFKEERGVRPSVRREKVLVFRGIDVTLQMFHPPTLIPGQL